MLELIKAGGFLMWPILGCSVISLAIIIERFWSLRASYVVPKNLLPAIWTLSSKGQLNRETIEVIRAESPLGRVLAAGLLNANHSREVMKEAIEEMGRQVVHELERFLNTLGTIAAIAPLLGLLGTVFGMIEVFSAITRAGVGNPAVLAGGISEALFTTAAGLIVAILSLMFHRYFNGLVERYVVRMEEEALKMIEVMKGERDADSRKSTS